MNAYTVSRLALDAGVSVHIVRDYLLRGQWCLRGQRGAVSYTHLTLPTKA